MASLVDELIVELSLDPSKFSTGSKRAAEDLANLRNKGKQGAKEIEESGKGIVEGFEAIGRRMVGFATAAFSGSAILGFVKNAVETNRVMSILASTTGTSIESLSGLKAAFDRLGYSGEKVVGVIDSWDRELKGIESRHLSFNSSKLNSLLSDLGALGPNSQRILMMKSATEARPAYDILLDISDAVGKLQSSGFSKNRIIGILMQGGFDRDTAALLTEGGITLRRQLELQRDILQVTGEQAAATNELNKSYKTMVERSVKLGNDLLLVLHKPLLETLDIMSRFVKFLDIVLNDPKSFLYIKPEDITGTGPLFGGKSGGSGEGGSAPQGKTGSNQGYESGTVHGHPVEGYGPASLRGQKLYDPVTATYLGGGVGGYSHAFGSGSHEGVDIMAPVGSPTFATFSKGRVTKIGRDSYGNKTITIQQLDQNGNPTGVYSRYLHQKGTTIQEGSIVSGGQQVGVSGYANAAHTHFEMWDGPPGQGRIINPRLVYGWGPANLPRGGQERSALGAGDKPPMTPVPAGIPLGLNQRALGNLMKSSQSRQEIKTEIGNVTVHSQAADPEGIAGDIKKALEKATFKERFEAVNP
jgi:murein DD-endopeptidase MepM/ murein hydrolase activator NlpD